MMKIEYVRRNVTLTNVVIFLGLLTAMVHARFKDKFTFCGTISYEYPAVRTRSLQLRFIPKSSAENQNVSWQAEKDGQTLEISNTTENINIHRTGHAFYLNHENWLDEDYDFYIANVIGCGSKSMLSVDESDIGTCGYLELLTDYPIAGRDARLVFVPTSSVWETTNDSDISWQHIPRTCKGNCSAIEMDKPIITKVTDKAEYVLTIPKTNPETSGNYTVKCTEERQSNTVTVDIIVPELPSEPLLLPLVNIHNQLYIIARESSSLNVSCNTTGGTNTTVEIFIGINKENTVRRHDLYTVADYMVNDEAHLKNVSCRVNSSWLEQPLLTTSEIYVVKTASEPTLRVDEVIEFHPIGIACSVMGRPLPNVRFMINDTHVDEGCVKQKDNITGDLSEASVTAMERSWNGKKIKCCASHELYSPQEVCSSEKTLNYKFRWKEIFLQLPHVAKEIRSYHVINITCTSVNANPECEVEFSGKGIVDKTKTMRLPTKDGGVTTSRTAILNVTSDSNGDKLTCYVNCIHFPTKQLTYVVQMPALPKVFVNVSNGNYSSTVEVKQGENSVFRCSAHGHPSPDIAWTYMGVNATDVHVFTCGRSKCLSIENIHREHRGNYSCTASNQYGADTEVIELVVSGYDDQLGMPPSLVPVALIVCVMFIVVFLILLAGVLVYVFARRRSKNKTAHLRNDTIANEETNLSKARNIYDIAVRLIRQKSVPQVINKTRARVMSYSDEGTPLETRKPENTHVAFHKEAEQDRSRDPMSAEFHEDIPLQGSSDIAITIPKSPQEHNFKDCNKTEEANETGEATQLLSTEDKQNIHSVSVCSQSEEHLRYSEPRTDTLYSQQCEKQMDNIQ